MQKHLFACAFFLFFCGCAIHDYTAPINEARKMHETAYQSHNELQFIQYKEACRLYVRAYASDFSQFDMTKSRDAMHACSAAREYDSVDTFRRIVKRKLEAGSPEILFSNPSWIQKYPEKVVGASLQEALKKTDTEIDALRIDEYKPRVLRRRYRLKGRPS